MPTRTAAATKPEVFPDDRRVCLQPHARSPEGDLRERGTVSREEGDPGGGLKDRISHPAAGAGDKTEVLGRMTYPLVSPAEEFAHASVADMPRPESSTTRNVRSGSRWNQDEDTACEGQRSPAWMSGTRPIRSLAIRREHCAKTPKYAE